MFISRRIWRSVNAVQPPPAPATALRRPSISRSSSSSMVKLPGAFVRGGTSKIVVVHEHDLQRVTNSSDQQVHLQLLKNAINTPDPYCRQLNGLGGGVSSLSKAVILHKVPDDDAVASANSDDGIDVDYTFVQLGIDRDVAETSGNCGNAVAAVALSHWEGLFGKPAADQSSCQLFNRNSASRIRATRLASPPEALVPESVAGVSGLGHPVHVQFLDPAPAVCSATLPTGSPVDELSGGIQASLVACTTPCVFVRATDLGIAADENPANFDPKILVRLEDLRAEGARKMGLDPQDSIPKIVAVSNPTEFKAPPKALDGSLIGKFDISVRALSMGACHKATPLTAALCLAGAATIPGTLPFSVSNECIPASPSKAIRIAHPSGVTEIHTSSNGSALGEGIEYVGCERSSRILMTGDIWIPQG